MYGVGDFVACIYQRKWFLGIVQKVEEDGEYEVKFMVRHQYKHHVFKWPIEDDILDIPASDIIMKTPSLTLNPNQVLLMDSGIYADINNKFLAFYK